MSVILKIIYLTLALAAIVGCSVLPVPKCRLDDSSCLLPAFQTALPIFSDGMPEIGVEPLDPLEMDDLAFDLSGLQFTLKQGRLKGIKHSVIDKARFDLKRKKLIIDYHLNSTVKGHYTAGGRLLILPINGDGQMKLKLRNVAISLYVDYEMETKPDGKEYLKPLKYGFDFDVKDNAYFNLTGLFNGNKELSDTMLAFLNENWKQVSLEFGRPVIDGAAKVIFKDLVAFFGSVPIADIAEA